ncbi:DUF3017 domain-containing protein [Nocardioides panacisoli]|uniref:DUF3017 domain-containing protein n=1 Tax=Nocardioides panacisoli TaxID=627624 RepID=A0ABP7IGA1_9ACTN
MTLIDDHTGEAAEEQPEEQPVEAAQPPADEPRRHPSTIGGALYLGVLAAMATGLGVVWLDDWRTGVRILAGALAAAALFRLVLPQRDAGMLAVRNRFLDVAVVGVVAVVLFLLAASIPNQPV